VRVLDLVRGDVRSSETLARVDGGEVVALVQRMIATPASPPTPLADGGAPPLGDASLGDAAVSDASVSDASVSDASVSRAATSLTTRPAERPLLARIWPWLVVGGVVLIGATTATGGRARCSAPERGGTLDCVDQLVSQGNGVAGLYVADARRTEVRRCTFADTVLTPIDGGEAGDGIFVGAEADVSLDPELLSPAVRGFGSALLGNGRAGILAQGLRARLSVRGAVLARNASGGLFVGARAEVPAVGESLFVENRFAGIVATPGSLVGIVQCNGIVDTAMGTLRGSTVTVQLGDGVHLNAASARVSMEENTILRSNAFGLLVNASALTLRANRGADNRFGVGTYGGASVDGDARTIVGREASPPVAPGLAVGP
jgi:hypothetical protein